MKVEKCVYLTNVTVFNKKYRINLDFINQYDIIIGRKFVH